ncbi:MAG: polyprenyl diphosphate synthase [Oligoflexia bacterium]
MVLIPRHVAIIMDGNGRWAESRGHARFFGHVRGAARIRGVVEEAASRGVEVLTLFAFSTENWKRPEQERSVLWSLLERYLKREVPELLRQNVRLHVMGDPGRLPSSSVAALKAAQVQLAHCTGMVLNLALSYGARAEIVEAAKKFAQQCEQGEARYDQLDERTFGGLLQTGDLGKLADVDLLIRTSGEQRISNFLLWQAAYAELVFVPEPWPEFGAEEFSQVLRTFEGRERRFGAVPVKQLLKEAGGGV